MNEDSLQKRYEFALDYIRGLEERIEELEKEIESYSRYGLLKAWEESHGR